MPNVKLFIAGNSRLQRIIFVNLASAADKSRIIACDGYNLNPMLYLRKEAPKPAFTNIINLVGRPHITCFEVIEWLKVVDKSNPIGYLWHHLFGMY